MLTAEQKRAIESNAKYLMIRAGAGTGKTEVLTRRMIRLLEKHQHLSISDIAVITFTNKATEQLTARLKKRLYQLWQGTTDPNLRLRYRYELESLNSCQISTIHKFCQSILDLAGPSCFDDFTYAPGYRITQGALYRALEEAFENWLVSYEEQGLMPEHCRIMPPFEVKKTILQTYQMLRVRGLNITKAIQVTKNESIYEPADQPRRLKMELAEVLSLLHKAHIDSRLQSLDPDDLLEYCYKLLVRRPDIAEEVKSKYKYLFVDEFQDTSAFQTGIIKALCEDQGPDLFVVGDLKQSIYQFRGADLASYENSADWIDAMGETLTLSTNFRSTPELVQFVNSKFKYLAQAYPQYRFKMEPLQPWGETTEPVDTAYEWHFAAESAEQPGKVAQYIRQQIDNGVKASEFAILFRANYPMAEYASSLAEVGVPFQLVGAGDFYNQREVVDTHKLLNLLINPSAQVNYQEVLNSCYFNGDGDSLDKMLADTEGLLLKLTPAQLLGKIYRKTKIRERLMAQNPQAAANLNKLLQLIRQQNHRETWQLFEVANWLQQRIFSHKEEQLADCFIDPKETNAVTLTTIHKAKGLEFPIVILPELDREYSRGILYPQVVYSETHGLDLSYQRRTAYDTSSISTANYQTSVETYKIDLFAEEMRVLYVALTRAEKKLVFIGSEDCPEKRECFQNWLRM